MKKFFREFKDFINRGNIMDLAVAVIIGGAFSAIVTAFTNSIIRPIVNYVLALIVGGNGLDAVYTFLKKVYIVEDGIKKVDLANSIYIDWGAFITAVIDFLIIAMVIFLMVKLVMNLSKGVNKVKGCGKHELSKEERKALKKQGLSCKEIKQKEIEAREARIAKEEAEKPAPTPTTEELLKEIRDLLAAQNKKGKSKE